MDSSCEQEPRSGTVALRGIVLGFYNHRASTLFYGHKYLRESNHVVSPPLNFPTLSERFLLSIRKKPDSSLCRTLILAFKALESKWGFALDLLAYWGCVVGVLRTNQSAQKCP